MFRSLTEKKLEKGERKREGKGEGRRGGTCRNEGERKVAGEGGKEGRVYHVALCVCLCVSPALRLTERVGRGWGPTCSVYRPTWTR